MVAKQQSDAKPACYCCLIETDLTEHNNNGLVYWLCSSCYGAGFQLVDDLYVLVCPIHGEQKHYDVENHKILQKRAKDGHDYNYPVHTRRTKERGLKPLFGIARYDEVKS